MRPPAQHRRRLQLHGQPYLCTTAFLPLGLPATNAVWTAPAQNRTSRKIWLGQDVKTDHAL